MSTALAQRSAVSQRDGDSLALADAVATSRNKLLALLPAAELERVMAVSTLVTIRSKEVLFRPGGAINYTHFPEDSVISLVTHLEDGDAVEAMTVGNDGFCAIALLNGVGSMNCEGVGQVTGTAWRIARRDFVSLFPDCPELVRVLHRYSQLVFETVSQSAACNRLHLVEQRCARWILMSHDRVGRSSFDLTQQFLSQMLGVRRAGVTVAMGHLERQGLVTHGRGWISVANRKGLEAVSCECYAVIREREKKILC